MDCIVLDKQAFPRFKPCAGWIQPRVFKLLQLEPNAYPHALTVFRRFRVSLKGVKFTLPVRQYAIRRVEFDAWLLERAGVPVHQHEVKTIRQTAQGYELDGEYAAKYLVGAGGTYCPVQRSLFRRQQPRSRSALIVAMEAEFRYDGANPECRLWFMENNLPGYDWYVPKAGGWVNAGVGGLVEKLTAGGADIRHHWSLLVEKLERLGLVRGVELHPAAHAYYLNRGGTPGRLGNAFLTGDSAGLATRDMGEGIAAAIHSGLLAAGAILNDDGYTLKTIPRYSFFSLPGWT